MLTKRKQRESGCPSKSVQSSPTSALKAEFGRAQLVLSACPGFSQPPSRGIRSWRPGSGAGRCFRSHSGQPPWQHPWRRSGSCVRKSVCWDSDDYFLNSPRCQEVSFYTEPVFISSQLLPCPVEKQGALSSHYRHTHIGEPLPLLQAKHS